MTTSDDRYHQRMTLDAYSRRAIEREHFVEVLEIVIMSTKLTTPQIAQAIGVSRWTVDKWRNGDNLPRHKETILQRLYKLARVNYRDRQGSARKGQVVSLEGLL